MPHLYRHRGYPLKCLTLKPFGKGCSYKDGFGFSKGLNHNFRVALKGGAGGVAASKGKSKSWASRTWPQPSRVFCKTGVKRLQPNATDTRKRKSSRDVPFVLKPMSQLKARNLTRFWPKNLFRCSRIASTKDKMMIKWQIHCSTI